MKSKAEKVLVVTSDETLRERIAAALSDAGYEVSTDRWPGRKALVAFIPDAVALGADTRELNCCDLLSEINGSEQTQNIRILMLSPAGIHECIG